MENEFWLLFASAFISSTLLPGGSEALLLFYANEGSQSVWSLWLVATLGNTLGGMSTWLIGRIIIWRFPARRLEDDKHQKALSRVGRWGSPVLLLSWLPFIGDPLCLVAGWLKINVFKALFFIFLGKGLRYGFLVMWT